MSRGTWNISIKSGGVWGENSTIYRPNDNFSLRKTSTLSMITLADGNRAYISSDSKYNDEDLSFTWYYDDGTVKSLVEGYIESENDLRITDQDGKIYYGRFINIESVWQVGFEEDYYDIRATFVIIPSLA